MLEDLLRDFKHKVLPIALSFSVLSSPAQAYTSRINVNGSIVEIEVCEDKNIIQGKAENWGVFKEASMHAFLKHQKEMLETEIKDLDYNTYKLAKDSASKSRIFSKKVNKVLEWMEMEEAKIPWWSIALYGLPLKFFALKEVKKVRAETKKYLEIISARNPYSPSEIYGTLLSLRKSVRNAKKLVKSVGEVTELELPFDLAEMEKFKKRMKSDYRYANLDRLEKTKEEFVRRIEEELSNSKAGKEYRLRKVEIEKEEKVNPFKHINKYSLVNENPKIFFKEFFEEELSDLNFNKAPYKALLGIKASKSCLQENNYNLLLELSVRNNLYEDERIFEERLKDFLIIDDPKTNVFVFYPSRASLGEIAESADKIKVHKRNFIENFSEILYSETDNINIDAQKYVLNKSIHTFAKGHVMQVKNVFPYLAKKLSERDKSRDTEDKELLDEILKGYEVRELPILRGETLASKYVLSIPINNLNKKPVYLLVNLGFASWHKQFAGRIEDILIEIPNDELPRGKGSVSAWIIPESWAKQNEDGRLAILSATTNNVRYLDPEGEYSQFANINLAGENYSLVNDSFFQMVSSKTKSEVPLYPIKISKEGFHLQFLSNDNGEGHVKGIFFGKRDDIMGLLPREEIKPALHPRGGYGSSLHNFGFAVPNLFSGNLEGLRKATEGSARSLTGEAYKKKEKVSESSKR